MVIYAYWHSFQGILHLRGRPTVAYDQQGLVFAVAMEGGAIKLFDSRSYDKVLIFKTSACVLAIYDVIDFMHFFNCRAPLTPF